MSNIISLRELANRLKPKSDKSILVPKTAVEADNVTPKLVNFLQTLPKHELLLNNAKLFFDNQQSPTKFSIQGETGEKWSIKGLLNQELENIRLKLTFTQQQDNSSIITELIIEESTLRIDNKNIKFSAELVENDELQLSLNQGNTRDISLLTIGNFVNPAIVNYLPQDIKLFEIVPFTSLAIKFSFDPLTPTTIIFVSDLNTNWEIVTNKIVLKQIGITLFNKYYLWRENRIRSSFSSNIHGKIQIVNDFDITISFQNQHLWELYMLPQKGSILPVLTDIAEFAGGAELKDTVKAGLQALELEEIGIDGVQIGFDPYQKSLRYISMRSHITLAGVQLDIYTQLPDFQFGGGLAQGSHFSFKALLTHYFKSADEFPEINIAEFSFIAYPNAKFYTIHATINFENGWNLPLKAEQAITLKVKSLELEITKSSTEISGSIAGSFLIAEASIYITAKHPASGEGWQFNGQGAAEKPIPIGVLVNDIVALFGQLTLPSAITSLSLEKLSTSFNTKSKDFIFTCEAKLNINGSQVVIAPDIALTHQQDGSYQKHFGGKIAIADLNFALSFDRNPNSKTFIATYNNPNGKQQSIKDLAKSVFPTVPDDWGDKFPITLKDALFACSSTNENKKTETKLLFILHIDSGINLSNLPLVGQIFPANQTIQLHYQILAASHYFSEGEVKHINTLVNNGISQLPAQDIGEKDKPSLGLAVTLQLGDAIEQLNLPITVDSSSDEITPKTTDSNSSQIARTNQNTVSISNDAKLTTSEGVKWYPLKKSFGPVHFQKIGVKCQEQKLWFLLDASLVTAGLTISLDGLAVSSPLTELKPEFHLNAIGIDYRSDTVEIGGAFLRKQVKQDGQTFDEYSGAAILRTQTKGKQLTLSAFGSYTYYEGHPSLFIYALLDYPLGGAPFLFVTGLAAGFGYNRTLRLPEKVEDVAQFPLVKIATGQAGVITDINQVLEPLKSFIPPATGELFFAVGIKFTSFKIIDSFALLTVQLGNRSEINILGLSTLIAPPGEAGVEPIAKAQLAFRATYLPDEGFLKVEAALLPGAYLFSGNCRLSGRFAFYSWFSGEHEGDFVLTLGGYHPDFNIPEHYPKLPRLQLNWQVDSKTSIKGDAYFALCSHTLMAGGHLELTYQSGDLKAWLKAGADFLIAWKPYHYDAHIYVTIGASYTFNLSLLFTTVTKTITAEVGADLHLWGPDFGGTATIHIWVVQINIDFGSRSSQQPNPIDWNSFKASFLPKDEEVCSIAVQDGLVRKIGKDKSELGIINPKRFSLVTNSTIPSKHAYKRKASSEGEIKVNETNTNLGIASMAVLSDDLKTEHIITITRNGQNVEEEFQYIPILKKVPIGLWGQPPSNDKPLMSSVNGQQFVESALLGFEIKPKEIHNPGQTQAVDSVNLQYEPEPAANGYSWETQIPFQADSSEDSDRRDRIRNTVTKNSMRENLLKNLGFDPDRDVDLSEAIADDFIITPQIKVY